MVAAQRRTVLLGAAGTGTAFGAAMAVRRHWSQSVRIVAMDINPKHLVSTSLLADAFYTVPLCAAPQFEDVLVRLIAECEIGLYMPLLPGEIVKAARLREAGAIPERVSVLAPSLPASRACADKWLLVQWLEACGVPVPKTELGTQWMACGKWFLKPRDGSGSRGARVVDGTMDIPEVRKSPEDWILQEVCDGPEVTVDVFLNPSTGFMHSICRERIEVKAGVCTKARLFADAELHTLAGQVASVLKLTGSFCLQFMRSAAGWVVTDANPRPGAATAMCATVGNDFFAATFALAWGEDATRFLQPLKSEVFVTRQYAEYLMGSKS